MRTLGLGLGFLCVASVLRERGAPFLVWAALVLNGFVWPHVAFALARRAPDPVRAEYGNLYVDSALGGVWVGVMAFNVLPSVLLVTMLVVDKVAVGGRSLLLRSAGFIAAGAAVGSAAVGFAFAPATSMAVVLSCMPFLVAYPVAISVVSHALSSRVQKQNRLLEELTRTDALTSLPNRARFEEVAIAELKRSARSRRASSLLMIDVDGFKGINDSFGHTTGDGILQGVAALLRTGLRDIDTPGRWGGDEFCVVLPETDLAAALRTAERLRLAVEAAPWTSGVTCTISVGAAETGRAADLRAWVAEADAGLYAAKASGRNRVASPHGVLPSADPVAVPGRAARTS
jgi:diguanylate cyclase